MEISKDIVSNSYYNNITSINKPFSKAKIRKRKTNRMSYSQIVIGVSLICLLLIIIDIVLICSFANMLQTVL